jgi:hypothetical protein
VDNALYHKVKRVYIAGDVRDWRTGLVRKKTGREVHGLRVEYEQTRRGYRQRGYAARWGETKYLWHQGPSLRLLSGLSRWSRFRRAPATYIFILTVRNCRRNTSRHCRKSDKGGRPLRFICYGSSCAVDLFPDAYP